MKESNSVYREGDIGVLFGHIVEFKGYQIGDNATRFELVSGKGGITGASLDLFEKKGLSCSRIKEMRERFHIIVGSQGYFTMKQMEALEKEVFGDL